MDGPHPPLAATPPGAADVLRGFCQQAPPPEGYTPDGFDRRIAAMAERQEAMVRAGDYRAVFHLTYLAFSRQVQAALRAGRFSDPAWAADMCCRFVDAYLEQLQRWDRRDPTQCRAWQVAFGSAQSGRANVLQSMFLGMNAHIHYDLAFVTLGACRAAGDLELVGDGQTLISRSGVPDSRHQDFLLINQVGWESLPAMQDVVLSTFSPALRWGSRLLGEVSNTLGQRLLMDARDASWAHTNLLVHAGEERARAAVAAVIDAHAASHTHLVAAMTANPGDVVDGVRGWAARHADLPDGAREELVRLAISRPAVADLALRQLAFAGADPSAVVDALVEGDATWAVGPYARMVRAHAPAQRRRDLERRWQQQDLRTRAVVEVLLMDPGTDVEDVPDDAVDAVRERWARARADDLRVLADPVVAGSRDLAAALRDHVARLEVALARVGWRPDTGAASVPSAHPAPGGSLALLALHPDPWVRVCAAKAAGRVETGGTDVDRMIERVLFLRTTTLFAAVDASALLPVAEALEVRDHPAGSVLVRRGQRVGGLHLLISGQVRVTQPRDGRDVEVARLGRAEPLGELSALDDAPATADCTAVTDVRTAFIGVAELARLLHQHPPVAIGLLRVLGRRLAETTARLTGTA